MFGEVGTNPFGFKEIEFQKCCNINPAKPNLNFDVNVTFFTNGITWYRWDN